MPPRVRRMPADQGPSIQGTKRVARPYEELHMPGAVEGQVTAACLALGLPDQAARAEHGGGGPAEADPLPVLRGHHHPRAVVAAGPGTGPAVRVARRVVVGP